MKKGIIATSILALAIGCMIVFLSVQLCNLLPSSQAACWIQAQVQNQQEELLVHQSQINTWHEKIALDYHKHVKSYDAANQEVVNGSAQECEMGKEAAYALGHSGEANALNTLESIALNANCLEVRKAAVHAIEGFGTEEARSALIRIVIATTG